jgi:adhesin/invasin
MKLNFKILYFSLYLILFPISSNSNEITNNLKNKFIGFFNQSLNEMFPYTEFGLTSGTQNEVTGSILVINPISEESDISNTTFFQGSLFLSDDSRETINLGIAIRKLLNDDYLLLGTNLFYDHELDYNHRRVSIGLEAISSVGSFTYNEYFRLSSWKSGVDNTQEKALNGRDMEIGSPLPFLPSTNLYYRTFEWEGASGAADQKGDDFSLVARFKRFNAEIGKRSFDGITEDEEFIRLTYRCCNDDNDEFVISDKAFNLSSVEDKRFAKVRRENLIVKQKEMDLTVIGF